LGKTGTYMTKAQLRRKADKLFYLKLLKERCEVCGKKTQQVHHFFPKGQFGHLRYDLNNGISLCNSCHFSHHSKGDPRIHQTIISKRGQKWYTELRDKSREPPASYQKISYYRDTINKLNKHEKENTNN